MDSQPRPETADHELERLRQTLKDQRAQKASALRNVKRTTMQAVKCYDTPTTFLDPQKLREKLAEDAESVEEETADS